MGAPGQVRTGQVGMPGQVPVVPPGVVPPGANVPQQAAMNIKREPMHPYQRK